MTRERMTAVFRASAQEAISRMQDRIPKDTGYARASLQVSKEQMPKINAYTARSVLDWAKANPPQGGIQ
jgi:hypothetical protein